MNKLGFLILLHLLWASGSQAQISLGVHSTVVFATREEAGQILMQQDDFFRSLSPFDRAARMKTDREVSGNEYLEFAGKNALEWKPAEKQRMVSALQGIQKELAGFSASLPEKIFLAVTTGNEEGGAAYTRSNAMFFPEALLAAPMGELQKTFCHELFHVLSRKNPALRDLLYAAIGFIKCGEIEFPEELKARKITNPDAPFNDHCIRLQIGNENCWAVPILFSSSKKYDVKRGGEIFKYLQFQFLLVERAGNSLAAIPMYAGKKPRLASLQQVSGFYEQAGRNTEYIIHPEEILADNFALLVLGGGNLPSPEVIAKLKELLRKSLPYGCH
jgi:hypothetical protein